MNSEIETFFNACAHGPSAEVDRLIDAGINVDVQMPDSGYTGLLRAAIMGNEETLALLIKRGADVNHNNQPLHFSALFGRTAICHALTMAGADTRGVDSVGNTPLHVAADFGWIGTCIALLNAGSDVHLKNHDGKSALMIAYAAGGVVKEAFISSANAWALTHAAIDCARAKQTKGN